MKILQSVRVTGIHNRVYSNVIAAIAVGLFAGAGFHYVQNSSAAVVASSAVSGNWSNPATWRSGAVPVAGDAIEIATGTSVVLDVSQFDAAGVTVHPGASLVFDRARSATLTSTKNILINGTLTMRPNSAANSHILRFVGIDEQAFVGGGMDVLATDIGLWVMGNGKLDVQGSTKTSWSRPAGAVAAGAASVTLESAPSGWRVGDQIAISPTEPQSVGSASVSGFDEATVTSISGSTIGLSTPTLRAHPMVNGTWKAEVMNLSRNVQIEGTPTGRSHIFIRSSVPQTVNEAAIRYMGPRPTRISTARPLGAEPKWPSPMEIFGRYGLHFHHMGDGSRGTTVTGTVVKDTGNHAFVPHTSHGISFRKTISYNTVYDAYWWDGPRLINGVDTKAELTHDTLYEDCVAAKVSAVGNSVRLSAFEVGAGDRNVINRCVAVGVAQGSDSSGFEWPEAAVGIWGFSDNIAHNNVTAGIFGWQNTSHDHVIQNFQAYHNNIGIEQGAYNNRYLYTGGHLYGNKGAGVQLHAVSTGDVTKTPLTFENMIIDNAGTAAPLIQTVGHNAATFIPTVFRGITFKGAPLVQQNNTSIRADVVDIVDSSFAPAASYKNVATPSGSVIRVQSGATAYAVIPAGHQWAPQATFVPEWNAYRLTINPFDGVVTATQDLIAPSVAVSVFDSNQTVSGVYTFRASIADNVAVTRAEFIIDGKPVHIWKTAPYTVAFDTNTIADGQHTGVIKGYDAQGNIGTREFAFKTANNQTTPPPVASVLGDANNDGKVNAIDLSILLSRDGQNYPAADFNKDGMVGAADTAILLSRWTW